MIRQPRKFRNGDFDVNNFLTNAENAGLDVYELVWTKHMFRVNQAEVAGIQVPIISRHRSSNPYDQGYNFNHRLVEGRIVFYPTSDGRCYGYIVDTEKNREFLAYSLADGWFKILDNSFRKSIEELATSMKLPLRPQVLDPMHANIKRDIEVNDLKRKIKKLEADLKRAEKQGAPTEEIVKELKDTAKIKRKISTSDVAKELATATKDD